MDSQDLAKMLRAAAAEMKITAPEELDWIPSAMRAAADALPAELEGFITEPIHHNEVTGTGTYANIAPVLPGEFAMTPDATKWDFTQPPIAHGRHPNFPEMEPKQPLKGYEGPAFGELEPGRVYETDAPGHPPLRPVGKQHDAAAVRGLECPPVRPLDFNPDECPPEAEVTGVGSTTPVDYSKIPVLRPEDFKPLGPLGDFMSKELLQTRSGHPSGGTSVGTGTGAPPALDPLGSGEGKPMTTQAPSGFDSHHLTTFHWPAKPDLPSVVLCNISNSTRDGQYVEFTTMYAREYALLEYAEEVRKVAYALVDEAGKARDDAQKDRNLAFEKMGHAEHEVSQLKEEVVDAQEECARLKSDRPAYEQAARQQGMFKAMEIVAEHAKAAQGELAKSYAGGGVVA